MWICYRMPTIFCDEILWQKLEELENLNTPTAHTHLKQNKQNLTWEGRKKQFGKNWRSPLRNVKKLLLTTKISPLFFSLFFSNFFFLLLLLLWLSCWLLWNQPRTKPQVSVHHHQLTFARMAGQHSQDYCLAFSTQENWKQPNKTNKIFSFFLVHKLPCEIWNMRSEK